MKVYGQRWDLPVAPYLKNPFRKYLKNVDAAEPEHRRYPRPPAVEGRPRSEEREERAVIDVPDPVPELMNDACTS